MITVDILVNGKVCAQDVPSLTATLTASYLSRHGWQWRDERELGYMALYSPDR